MYPRVRWATEADLPAIAEVSSLAFDPNNDPVAGLIFPAYLQKDGKLNARAQIPWRTSRKIVAMGDPNGRMIVLEDQGAEDQSPVIIGFANWFTHKEVPHQAPHVPTPENGSEEAWVTLKKKVNDGSVEVFGQEALEDLWYISHLAVHPDHQRKGHGKRLLDWSVDDAQKASRDMYLVATPWGVALYKAAGFKKVGTVDLNGVIHEYMILKAPGKS